MWTYGVVVETPDLNYGLGIGEVEKSMLVQAPVPEAAVEAFDEGVLHGSARLDESGGNVVVMRPLIHRRTAEFRGH
jgi:hypothetical protein